MKKKVNWHEQLDDIVVDSGTIFFGHNCDWDIKNVRKYLLKLEDLGATNINILGIDDILLTLPDSPLDCSNLLLFIITGGGFNGRMPAHVIHNKKKNTLCLEFDY